WIQCELGEILDIRNEKIIPDSDYPLMSFTSSGGIEEKGDRYDRSFLVKNSNKKYKVTKFNDLIYSSNNLDVGAIGLNKFGNACISIVYEIFSIIDDNPDVVSYILQTPRILHKIISYRQGALYGQYKIHSTDFLKVKIFIPKMVEQEKISELINNLDFIITLEQEKIEKLELLKKYLLQHMFADESGYPNLRFRGYTGPWFKNKGKNIFKKITEKKQAHLPVLSATQDKGMVLRDEFNERLQYDRKNLSNYKVVRPGQFVVHLRSFQGGFAHSNYLGITSPAYTIFDFINTNEHNDIYWKFYFANDHFILLLEKVTYGIRDGRTINFSDFCTLNINFPSLSEQNKIAKLLFSLDSLINLRITKLENLTSLKQKLLSSLFI
ncbi:MULTISPECIES: restriction endonuclease subunit S, partial [unclassified Aerococcus]|uniref:restriction endonuclease subunit S n=1 Tax=unclassified Aerococcus TaxID=2618060 RepID=UPI001AF0126F